ncbi:MAG TPA: hypothetical protein VII11_00725 [Bacteroidota bacterium]
MPSSTAVLKPDGNSPSMDGNFPSGRGGLRYRLHKKIAIKGFTPKSFAEHHGLKRRDVSNYLRGRYERIGRRAKKKIKDALIAEGLLKPRKPHPKFPCPACGRMMSEPLHNRIRATEDWLNKRPPRVRKAGRVSRLVEGVG